MKNLTFLLFSTILFVITVPQLVAQVGIGTSDPQATLHIAGENSTIRIDGLNKINNPDHDFSRKVPVAVDEYGNLVLERPLFDRFKDTLNFLSTAKEIEIKTANGFKIDTLFKYEIQESDEARLLLVSYQVGVKITKHDSGSDAINKTHEFKLFGAAIVVSQSETISQTLTSLPDTSYGSSTGSMSGSEIYDGKAYLNGQAVIKLMPSTTPYYLHLVGFVNNNDESSVGIRATYGSTSNDIDRFQYFELN